MSHFTLGVVNVGGGECRGGECRTILPLSLSFLFLSGANSVIGKAIVIHAGQSKVVIHIITKTEEDDYGLYDNIFSRFIYRG